MPKPISVSLKLNPLSLESKGELARHFPIIITLWADTEDELALLFALALGTTPAHAVVVLGRVNSLQVRLDMIREAIAMSFSAVKGKQFQDFFKEIRKCSNIRSDIVHSYWTAIDTMPDCLIRTAGLRDRELKQFAYDEQDFLEIQLRFGQLHIDLKQFAQSLLKDHPNTDEPLPHWRSVPPHPDET